MDRILMDTHIIVDLVLSGTKPKDDVLDKIENSRNTSSLFISSITLWEIAMLVSKKRIEVYKPMLEFLEEISNIDGLSVVDINPKIASESVILNDFHLDPSDRIIVATARIMNATLITRDSKIISWNNENRLVRIIEG